MDCDRHRVGELKADQDERWGRGERPWVENYAAQFPDLGRKPGVMVELILNEMRWLARAGEPLRWDVYLNQLGGEILDALLTHFQNDLAAALPDDTDAPFDGGEAVLAMGSDGTLEARTVYQNLTPMGASAAGGMGELFLAIDGVSGRRVVIKIPASDAGRERFLEEAERTARLEHPGIAPVYGIGRGEGGRPPFYAMRYIEGLTLTERIKQIHSARKVNFRGAEQRELLGRFIAVCRTVAYAHSQRELHRDIKPANIVLGAFGETVVLDWGLGKSLDAAALGPGTDGPAGNQRSMPRATDAGGLGTKGYCSPEQEAGRSDLIGPASDVYSLGATLYELLTGKPPDQVQVEYARDGKCSVRPSGHLPPRRVNKAVARPLQAICLKAMAPLPASRYASADGLADDLARWLAAERVDAYREAWPERLIRWSWRHPVWGVAARAAGVVLLAALAGLMAIESRANRRLELSRARTRQNFQLALDAVKNFHSGAGETVLRKEPRLQGLRIQLLETSRAFYEKIRGNLEAAKENDAESLSALAESYSQLGSIEDEVGVKLRALEHYQRSETIWQRLISSHPRELLYKFRHISCLESIGLMQRAIGRTDAALVTLGDAERAVSALLNRRPGSEAYIMLVERIQANSGAVLVDLGRDDEALASYQRARNTLHQLGEPAPDKLDRKLALAKLDNNIAELHLSAARPAEALKAYEQSRSGLEELVGAQPKSTEYRGSLAIAHNNVAQVLFPLGRVREALDSLERARVMLERLVEENPTFLEFQLNLAATFNALGNLHGSQDRLDAALLNYRRARGLLGSVVDADPSVDEHQRDLAATDLNIGMISRQLHQEPAALEALHRARAALERLAGQDHPNASRHRIDLAHCRGQIGLCLRATQPEEALRALLAASDILESFADLTGYDQFNLACYLAQCLPLLGKADRDQRAAQVARRAIRAARNAIDSGFRDARLFENSAELAPIHTREDFQRLMEGLRRPKEH
jgi:eukaryotic-like serine/threonine-protein kinase